jgi:Zn-dependent protease
VPPFIVQFLFFIRELLRIPLDLMFGIKRRSYALSMVVEAPKSVTWSVASAHQITLEGTPPIKINALPDPAQPGVYAGTVSYPGREFKIAYRVLEERPGEALLMEIVPDKSSPECCPGDNYVCAVGVSGNDDVSTASLTQQITHNRFSSRLLVPLATSQNLRRIKYNAELKSGRSARGLQEQVKEAVITGLLTFASFFAMFGWETAAMLLGLILIHEIGHVVAMRWVGIPVKGIYFVPFFGGVAVSADRYRSEGERGLVALMGPGFSLATTALFAGYAMQGGDQFARELAFMSAILNVLNLLPILPLDGGHVLQALLSRFNQTFAQIVHGLALMAGVAFGIATERYVLAVFLLVIAPAIFSRNASAALTLPALTRTQWALLAVAYLGSILFYVAIMVSLGDAGADAGAT